MKKFIIASIVTGFLITAYVTFAATGHGFHWLIFGS